MTPTPDLPPIPPTNLLFPPLCSLYALCLRIAENVPPTSPILASIDHLRHRHPSIDTPSVLGINTRKLLFT